MELAEAIEKGMALVVNHPVGGLRFAAEMFIVPKGVVFHDIGWDSGSTHGVHLLEGELTGEGPWKIGDAEIRILDEEDSVCVDMLLWKQYRTTSEGQLATRERARTYMCNSFGWPT